MTHEITPPKDTKERTHSPTSTNPTQDVLRAQTNELLPRNSSFAGPSENKKTPEMLSKQAEIDPQRVINSFNKEGDAGVYIYKKYLEGEAHVRNGGNINDLDNEIIYYHNTFVERRNEFNDAGPSNDQTPTMTSKRAEVTSQDVINSLNNDPDMPQKLKDLNTTRNPSEQITNYGKFIYEGQLKYNREKRQLKYNREKNPTDETTKSHYIYQNKYNVLNKAKNTDIHKKISETNKTSQNNGITAKEYASTKKIKLLQKDARYVPNVANAIFNRIQKTPNEFSPKAQQRSTEKWKAKINTYIDASTNDREYQTTDDEGRSQLPTKKARTRKTEQQKEEKRRENLKIAEKEFDGKFDS